ncbi:calcium-binding protein [Nocardioides speluncae]|uniref:calcium-binding protein n=1 Tax=Nocardioides speluncae TaxID=2670337 RepID=UPI000D69715D|nr:calcium-binding protein [Nocardioides speluncae]
MTHPTPARTGRRGRRLLATAAVVGVLTAGIATGAAAFVAPGTNGNDVTVGADNDNADNTFIQPPGVAAKQHMDNTDVLFGRGKDDLLIGRLGGDTALGGSGSDILVGGPEDFAAPNSDVLVGDTGNDINIWAPGDGSDAFIGNENYDTMIFAPFVEKPDGSLVLSSYGDRKVPRVDIDEKPNFSCTIVAVPRSENLGFQFLVRFNVNGTPAVTVRQKDVEKVFCPSPVKGQAKVAYLNTAHPQFRNVWLSQVPGTVGAILKPTAW